MKRLTLIFVVLAAVAAPAAHASDRQLLILQDHNAMLGQPDATAQQFAALGADVVKIQLFWGDVAPGGRAQARRVRRAPTRRATTGTPTPAR